MARQHMVLTMIIVVAIVLLFMAGAVTAQTPSTPDSTLPYSGRLMDPSGQPVTDGAYDFVFTLYASEEDDQALWSEMQLGLEVRAGNLNVILGNSVGIPKEIADRKELWLAVSVRGPNDQDFTLLNPRQRFTEPTSPSELTCPHSHFTDYWNGTNGTYGLIVENSGAGDGIRVSSGSTSDGYAAIWAINTASTGNGLAVYANSSTGFGVSAIGNDASYYDLSGDLVLGGTRGEIFTFGDILDLYTNDYVSIDLDNDNNDTNSDFAVLNGADTAVFHVYENGSMTATGTKSAEVQTATYGSRLMYAMESPEVWFEDIGTAYLKEGAVTVLFDPVFAETIDLRVDYHVFVTPICDEAVVLFVTTKSAEGFTVQGVTLDSQPSSCAFDYRVVAKRLGYESTRLAPTVLSDNIKSQR